MSDERMDRIEQKLDHIQAVVSEFLARCPMHDRRIQRVEAAIWGNGSAGLAVKVNAIVWAISGLAGLLGLVAARTISVWVSG